MWQHLDEEHTKGIAGGKGKGMTSSLPGEPQGLPLEDGVLFLKFNCDKAACFCRTHQPAPLYLDLHLNLGVLVGASWCQICLWKGSASSTAGSSAPSACNLGSWLIFTILQYVYGGKGFFPPCRGDSGAFCSMRAGSFLSWLTGSLMLLMVIKLLHPFLISVDFGLESQRYLLHFSISQRL